MSNIESYLFNTNAVRFFEENKPFWYTSGKIGPYFINTHFVYGNEKDAIALLTFIDESLSNKDTLPNKVFNKTLEQYNSNEIYKNVIDTMVSYIKENINISDIDYISGGERRDWFFSNIISYILHKPHISIYKDLSTKISKYDFSENIEIDNLDNKKVLHIADLITVASSYLRAWIPAVENLGAKIIWSCVVVDRMQGGKEAIEQKGITSYSLVNVDTNLFKKAQDMNLISNTQVELLNKFYMDPDNTMKEFLIAHPEFIEDSLNSSDEKTKKRAILLKENNIYGIFK